MSSVGQDAKCLPNKSSPAGLQPMSRKARAELRWHTFFPTGLEPVSKACMCGEPFAGAPIRGRWQGRSLEGLRCTSDACNSMPPHRVWRGACVWHHGSLLACGGKSFRLKHWKHIGSGGFLVGCACHVLGRSVHCACYAALQLGVAGPERRLCRRPRRPAENTADPPRRPTRHMCRAPHPRLIRGVREPDFDGQRRRRGGRRQAR